MTKTKKTPHQQSWKGYAVVSAEFPSVLFCAVPHDEPFHGTRNMVVRMTKRMLGGKVKTKLIPVLILPQGRKQKKK